MDYSEYRTYEFDNSGAINIFRGSNATSYPAHWHTNGEIFWVGPGDECIYMVNQTEYHLVEGDFVLIWPTQLHAAIKGDLKNSLIIQYSDALVSSMFDLQRILHFYHNLHILCIVGHPELVTQLGHLAREMEAVFLSGDVDKEIRCTMLFLEFMLTLDRNRDVFAKEIGSVKRKSYSGDMLSRIVTVTDYIKTHLTDENLTQTVMAEMAGISKEHFSRVFKNITGQNYSKWLNMIRIEKAVSLLSQKELSLTEVALMSGFQSIPSFNRVFRAEKRMAPGEFRSLYLLNQTED